MKENLTHYRTCVCNANYHMVWSVKYLKGSCGTIPIMWKQSDLYRKKTSAGTSNIRAKLTDTMEERKCCCQRKHP